MNILEELWYGNLDPAEYDACPDEEYKELVDLLIQLRTPKLSKDFKPTVLNEILSSSLPPLSDEDLRPMSEAIENMDNLKAQLETLEESKKASEKILETYDCLSF